MAKFRNTSGMRVKDAGLGIDVGPGEICEVADGYARPLSPHGSDHHKYESVVTRQCPQLVLVDENEKPEYMPVPKKKDKK